MSSLHRLKTSLFQHMVPYDLYERHAVVSRLLREETIGSSRSTDILDVGGRAGLLQTYTRGNVLSINPDGTGNLVGKGSLLPFPDSTFDAVVTIDTLEHLPRAARLDMALECWRVARRVVLIAAPYGSQQHCAYEEALDRYHRAERGFPHSYLSEHIRYGLPNMANIRSLIEALEPASARLCFAGDFVWQGKSFELAIRAHGLSRWRARVANGYNRLQSAALFHPIRLRSEPAPTSNRFYLVMAKHC